MDPLPLASFLKEYGGWGVSALLIAALIWTTRGWLNCFESRLTEGNKTSALLERATQAITATSVALENRQGYFERIGLKVDDAKQQAELTEQRVLAKLEAMERAVDELRRSGASR